MDFRRLEAFCKVFELGSFSKAGQDLFLSQPTVSAHIANLEADLGVQLFDRLGRSIQPTQAGQVLYRNVKDLFARLAQARSEIDLLRDKVAGELSVGGSTIPSLYILPSLLAGFLNAHREVTLRLLTADTAAILDALLAGRIAAGVVGSLPERREITAVKLLDDDLVVVAAPTFARIMAGERSPAAWPWIMRERGSGTRKAFEEALEGHGLSLAGLTVRAWVESSEAALQCVRAGIGASLVSRLAAAEGLSRGELEVVNVLPFAVPRSFYLVYHEGVSQFPVTRAFIEHVQAQIKPAGA
jgi:DNA-binding transcriptional LysR family regulator